MFHFLSTGTDERNQAERHVGRLSHLSTVGLMLVETETRRGGGGLPQALGNISGEGSSKTALYKTFSQCLSALCKESYPRPPPSTSTLSLTSFQSLLLSLSASNKPSPPQNLGG